MTTRDDWGDCDSYAQEETIYTLVVMRDRLNDATPHILDNELTGLGHRHEMTVRAHDAAISLLTSDRRDIVQAADELAAMTHSRDDLRKSLDVAIEQRDHALDINTERYREIQDIRAERDEAIKERDEARRVNAERYDEIRELAAKVSAYKTLCGHVGNAAEARAAFVAAMAKPAATRPSCQGCEHSAVLDGVQGNPRVCWLSVDHGAIPAGVKCPGWCPLLEGDQ